MTAALLDWYHSNGRDMPWRVRGGAHPDAYAVWISEIMLQQTTVRTVGSYFLRWMERFPTIESLARADLHDVLLAWQGLGYYTRAKKIHACARVLMEQYRGRFPRDRKELLKLPGIGPYTASSICCFAFNLPETVVDGNVIRVIARLYGLTQTLTKEDIYPYAQRLTPPHAGADYASAIMDLGATVCHPASPRCDSCPWSAFCEARLLNLTDKIPQLEKPKQGARSGFVYIIRNKSGAFYIRKRAGQGLLSGLYEFPWHYAGEAPLYPRKKRLSGKKITHTFTHFKLTLQTVYIACDTPPDAAGAFVMPADFKDYPFSTLMRKIIQKGLLPPTPRAA